VRGHSSGTGKRADWYSSLLNDACFVVSDSTAALPPKEAISSIAAFEKL
jgi:hypothetical protein